MDNLDMMNKGCMEFNKKYNYRRYHGAIRYQKPGEYVATPLLGKERRKRYGI